MKYFTLHPQFFFDVHFYGKGNKHRITPLSKEIWRQYCSYCERYHPEKNEQDYLFYSFRNGRRNKMSSDNVSRILAECENELRKKNTDLIHLHSHLFRRTRAMHLYQAKVPLPTISEWLGHSNVETTRFYAKVTEEMKREALHKLSDSDKSVFKDDVVFHLIRIGFTIFINKICSACHHILLKQM